MFSNWGNEQLIQNSSEMLVVVVGRTELSGNRWAPPKRILEVLLCGELLSLDLSNI